MQDIKTHLNPASSPLGDDAGHQILHLPRWETMQDIKTHLNPASSPLGDDAGHQYQKDRLIPSLTPMVLAGNGFFKALAGLFGSGPLLGTV